MPNKQVQYVNDVLSTSTTDEVLLSLIAEDDQSAFSILYKRYCPILQRFCMRMLNGDASLAADIVDESMYEVWVSAANFAGKSKPSTWIHSISRYKMIDYLRKNSDSKIDKDLLLASVDEYSPSAESVFAKDQQENVVRHMDKLSPDHRDALSLAYFKELSVKEMSSTLNISESTVKTRLFYARRHFKKILLKTGIHRNRFSW